MSHCSLHWANNLNLGFLRTLSNWSDQTRLPRQFSCHLQYWIRVYFPDIFYSNVLLCSQHNLESATSITRHYFTPSYRMAGIAPSPLPPLYYNASFNVVPELGQRPLSLFNRQQHHFIQTPSILKAFSSYKGHICNIYGLTLICGVITFKMCLSRLLARIL